MRRRSYAPSNSRGQRGTFRKLSNGRWKVSYFEDGRSGRRPSRTFDTKHEGADWVEDELAKLDAPPPSTAELRLDAARTRTVDDAIDAFLDAHDAAPPTIAKLRRQLRQLSRVVGTRPVQSLEPHELRAWRIKISEGQRHDVFRAARQMLAEVERWGWIESNPTAGVQNRKPKRKEVVPPPWADVLTIADEIDQRYAAVPVFVAGTGLRVEEWIALERHDLDLDNQVVRVRRVRSARRTVELSSDGSKTWRQRRQVPLRQAVIGALAAMPSRIDTPLVFPSPRGDYLDSERFLTRYWKVALEAGGVRYFPPKDMRHVYASESLAAGVPLFTLSRRMGTSLQEIDRTYGHLVGDSAEVELRLLNAYDQARTAGE